MRKNLYLILKKALNLLRKKSSTIFYLLLRKNDFYSYVIANTLNAKLKPFFLSYHAFYLELLRSRFISKEHSVCKMRMSFWEDSLKGALNVLNIIKINLLIYL